MGITEARSKAQPARGYRETSPERTPGKAVLVRGTAGSSVSGPSQAVTKVQDRGEQAALVEVGSVGLA